MRLSVKPSHRIIGFGLLGGVLGTALMDVAIAVTFLLADMPVDGFFDMVGDKFGQGPAVGVVLHNLVGLSVGFVFAALVLSFKSLNVDTWRKGLILGVSAGAITIPLGCIPLAIWLGEPILEVVAFSFVPHLIYGTVLGLIVTFGVLSWSSAELV